MGCKIKIRFHNGNIIVTLSIAFGECICLFMKGSILSLRGAKNDQSCSIPNGMCTFQQALFRFTDLDCWNEKSASSLVRAVRCSLVLLLNESYRFALIALTNISIKQLFHENFSAADPLKWH